MIQLRSRAPLAALLIALGLSIGGVAVAGAQEGAAPAAEQTAAEEAAPEASAETAGEEAAPQAASTGTTEERAALAPARLKLTMRGVRHGKLMVGERVKVSGTLAPFVGGQKVTVIVRRKGKTIKRKRLTPKRKPGSNFAKFSLSQRGVKPGRYTVRAIHKPTDKQRFAADKTRPFKIRYPSLHEGQRNSKVKLLNKLLAQLGYVNDGGKAFDAATARAVLAFRKVNGLSRTSTKATGKIFKTLAAGGGGFKLRYPGAGKHVETDISRQVMVLAKGDEVDEIYHISSGAPATPTVRGHFHFYRKEPGVNNKGMVHSVYFIRGYATHGYPSVPIYPASHGCVRNPIPDALHIYNWIDLGDSMYVYD